MSPRWLIPLSYLLLVCSPTQTKPQMVLIKTVFCVVWSASFVAANCAPCERFMCRILASRINKFCTTFPCTNYGSPSINKCTHLPFGCRPWHIKPFGLCGPFKFCCHVKNKADTKTKGYYSLSDIIKQQKSSNSRWKEGTSRRKTPNLIENFFIPTNATVHYESNDKLRVQAQEEEMLTLLALWNQTEAGVMNIGPFHLPHAQDNYIDDWPENDQDPVIVEKTIKVEYDKFVDEVKTINTDEIEHGRDAVRVPSFDEFRSMALGEKSIEW